MQADEEDTDADRVQKMFEDAFKGNLWAGGRLPNVMAGLQRAILDGVLHLRSIEAHRLVCLSHNLHVKDLRQTWYTKVFLEFHKYLACLQSARATLLARRGRGPAAGRTCKILKAEVKELRGEPQASTRGLTGVQCGRGEGCNAMSKQNLEEEVACGQTD